MPYHFFRLSRRGLLMVALAWSALAARAQYTWTGNASGTFSTAGNWSPSLPANDGTATLNFTSATGNASINFDANWSVAGMVFDASVATFSLQGSGVMTVGNGGIVKTGNGSINSSGGSIVLTNANTPLSAAGTGTFFLNETLSGSGGFEKTGSGTLAMGTGSVAHSFTGAVTVTAGNLSVSGDNKFGAVPASPTPGAIALNGGTLSLTQTATISANRGIAVTAASALSAPSLGTVTYGGVMTGSAALTKIGNGNFTLTGNSTYSGTLTVNAGNVVLSTSNALASATVATGSGTLKFSNNITSAAVAGLSGSGALSLSSGTGVAVALTVGGGNGSSTYSGAISNTGSLTKTGTGTLTLSNSANSYSGGTTVNRGTLLVTGNLTGAGGVAVNSGGALGGTGTIAGNTTVGSGGVLAPGTAAGTLTFSNGLTLAGGSTLNYDLGTTSDLIRVTGGTFTGPSPGLVTFNLANSGGFGTGTYSLVNYSTASGNVSVDPTDFTVGTGIAGYDYSFSISSSVLYLTVSTIPEPSTYAALAGVAGLVIAILRRRSQRRPHL